jgi:hypothetical protein
MLVVILAFAAAGTAAADKERRIACSDSLVRGTYGLQLHGTNLAPGGVQQALIGVVIRHYDGAGVVVQWDNVKGTVTGLVPNRYASGTYQVNDDCTVDITFNPAPGVLLVERAVIVDGGTELLSIVVSPATTMVTAVHRRI